MIREESFSTIPLFVRVKSLNKSDFADYLLSLIALAQYPLVFVQLLLISYGWTPESTTIYRVVLSAGTITLALPIILKRKGVSFIGTYLFLAIIYCYHVVVFPDTINYWQEIGFRFLVPICIPTLFCVLSLKNVEFFYIALKQICIITAVCCVLYGVRLATGVYDTEDTYFMNFGFLLLLPVIFFFLDNKWYSIILSLLFFVFVLVFGSRGPLISIVAFAVYFIVRKKKYLLLILIIILAIIGFKAFPSFLDSLGLSSRTIQMFLEGEMMSDTGRDEIRRSVYIGIMDNPILGNGLFGDRVLSNGYAHNFFIEVICQWGFILGGILVVALLYGIIYTFFYLSGYQKDIFVAMMCILFLPLMTSGSYLQNPNFFIFIGLIIVMSRKKRKGHNLACLNN